MTIDEVAEALGRDIVWVEARVCEGLPFRFEDGTRQFSAPVVRDWLIEQKLVAPEPVIVTRVKDVAEHFGVTSRAVQDWKDQGMPWEKDRFDLTAIGAWREARKGNSQDRQELQERGAAETRLAIAKASKAEAELEEFLGQLIRVDGPKRVLVQTVNAIRTHLEQFPERLAEVVNLAKEEKLEVRRACSLCVADLLRAIQAQLQAAGDELVLDGRSED
jgi:phage terminase Nu1 subunit (DNA packaging protein)